MATARAIDLMESIIGYGQKVQVRATRKSVEDLRDEYLQRIGGSQWELVIKESSREGWLLLSRRPR